MTVISTDTDEVIRAIRRIEVAENGVASEFALLPSPSMLDFGLEYARVVAAINGCRNLADRLVKHSYGVRGEIVKLDIAILQSQGGGLTEEQYNAIKSNLESGPPVVQGKGVVADTARGLSEWGEAWDDAKDQVFGAVAHYGTEVAFAVSLSVNATAAATGSWLAGGEFDVGKQYREIDEDTRFLRKPVEEALQVGIETVLSKNPVYFVVDEGMQLGGYVGDVGVAVSDHEGAASLEEVTRSSLEYGVDKLVPEKAAPVVDWLVNMGATGGSSPGEIAGAAVVDGMKLMSGDPATSLKAGDWLDRTLLPSGQHIFGPAAVGSGPVAGTGGSR